MPSLIEIKNLTKKYQLGEHTVYALRDVSISIQTGEFVAIMGPSGSGKSTLMHLMGLLDSPSSGSYHLEAQEISRLNEDDLAALRRKTIGFIFQQFNLLPRVSACENVSLPLIYSAGTHNFAAAEKILKHVGLSDRLLHKPNELSGGQQQRVAIARSLINNPRIILADEPTGNLDSQSEKEIMQILKNLNKQGITIILVTHEEEIGKQAKRLIRMRDGQILSDQPLQPLVQTTQHKQLASAKIEPNQPDNKQPVITQSKTPNIDTLSDEFIFESELKTATESTQFQFRFTEHFKQGYRTLAANKIRTGLSILGILIGVASVVAMMALGSGAQKEIEKQLAALGSNLLVLRPGVTRIGGIVAEGGSANRLTLEDVQKIKEKVFGVKNVSPNLHGRAQITYANKNWSTQILGVTSSYAPMRSSIPEFGRFFDDEEDQKRARVAVIGLTVLRELFGNKNPIGEMIRINRVVFQVIGVLPEKGGNGWRDQDDVIAVPLQTAMFRLLGRTNVDSIDIEVEDPKKMDQIQDKLLETVLAFHKIPPSRNQVAFQVNNMADLKDALAQSSNTMSALLAAIAGISLLVGGIGIMNIMLVSVTERTREIGLRKAIGARRTDILNQFLTESVVVSLVGGISGIFVGWLATLIISNFAGWTTSISLGSLLLALFFSSLTGIVFGLYPAHKASQLHPIEALRYE
jgi:macrolide transport system ATP-binding/permease protein